MKKQITKVSIIGEKLSFFTENFLHVYSIEVGPKDMYFITATNGYNGFEGEGDTTIEAAIKKVRKLIKQDMDDLA